jgi:hypothetical protein
MTNVLRVVPTKDLPPLPPDDTPHLVYNFVDQDERVDEEIFLSFTWTGDLKDPVGISPDAHGERIQYSFYIQPGIAMDYFQRNIVQEFELACRKWIATVFSDLLRGVHQ